MTKDTKQSELFCDYFERWVKVYKDGAIRKSDNEQVFACSSRGCGS